MKESKRFKPHYNSALGKMIHTKDDYLKEMKKGGYVPYDDVKDSEPKRKEYKPSQWSMEMQKQIRLDTDSKGNYTPSGAFKAELIKRGTLSADSNLKARLGNMDSSKGGFR